MQWFLQTATPFSGMLSYATSMGSQAEMGMNSVERMTEYMDYESEAPAILPDNRYCCTYPSVLQRCAHSAHVRLYLPKFLPLVETQQDNLLALTPRVSTTNWKSRHFELSPVEVY